MNKTNLVREEITNMVPEEYAPSMEESQTKCNLSLNVNPIGVSPAVTKRLVSLKKTHIYHYYPENTKLIEQIAAYLNTGTKNILLGDGCDGCLEMIAHTFINDGDEVIIPVPTFHRYEFHSKLMGGKPIFVQMPEFRLDKNKIMEKVTDKTKILFLCNPNNPTGMILYKDVKESIIKDFPGIVVLDEALADVTKVNGVNLIKKYDNLIIARSFSKTFGLASLRIGYIVTNESLIREIRKTSSPFKVNGIAQELAIAALADKAYFDKSVKLLNEELNYLLTNLRELGFSCTNAVTTNFLMDISKLNMDSTIFVENMKKKGILLTDAKIFKVPHNKYVRISVGTHTENVFFVHTLKKLIH